MEAEAGLDLTDKSEHEACSDRQKGDEQGGERAGEHEARKSGNRLLLQASEAELACGAVQTIKCRFFPDTKLFEEFKRRCKTTETHPPEIHFCGRCGGFFVRGDSLKRHRRKPQGHVDEGRGKAHGDGTGPQGLHPAVGA
jgi:hypothetical protein